MASKKPGLPKKYAKMGFKKGWAAYKRDHKTKSSSKRKSRPRSTKSGGTSRMGKRSGFNTQKLFKVIRMVALAAPHVQTALGAGTPQQKVNTAVAQLTGYSIADGTFAMERLAKGWGPYVAASLITYGIPKLNSLVRSVV